MFADGDKASEAATAGAASGETPSLVSRAAIWSSAVFSDARSLASSWLSSSNFLACASTLVRSCSSSMAISAGGAAPAVVLLAGGAEVVADAFAASEVSPVAAGDSPSGLAQTGGTAVINAA